ncbi:MAG: DUF2240 family protein [Natrialbaceae archaeon]|nr:DUF2240 family protein [Natrialbaceae archaeon]
MTLRIAVAAPFVQAGTRRMPESEFTVALSLDRGWFTPDQVSQLIEVATGAGLLEHADGDLRLTVDPADVAVPDGFEPAPDILRTQSPFEQVLDVLVADGIEKRAAVGGINSLQANLEITIEAAAVLYAVEHDVDVSAVIPAARAAIAPDATDLES